MLFILLFLKGFDQLTANASPNLSRTTANEHSEIDDRPVSCIINRTTRKVGTLCFSCLYTFEEVH